MLNFQVSRIHQFILYICKSSTSSWFHSWFTLVQQWSQYMGLQSLHSCCVSESTWTPVTDIIWCSYSHESNKQTITLKLTTFIVLTSEWSIMVKLMLYNNAQHINFGILTALIATACLSDHWHPACCCWVTSSWEEWSLISMLSLVLATLWPFCGIERLNLIWPCDDCLQATWQHKS